MPLRGIRWNMAPSTTPHSTGPTATVVAVVGPGSDDALASFDGVAGIDAFTLRDLEPAIGTRRIAASAAQWVVHDADPLEHVAAAWVELFEERSTLGVLEAEVDAALDAFDGGDMVMPDYYVVLDPEGADPTWRHWWCGALAHRAPRRILPFSAPGHVDDTSLRRMLNALPTSRPWPDPAQWLRHLPFEIPDRVGLRDGAV